jgi:TPR repeat protein
MYEYHHGVIEDDAKAAAYYERGCDAGHVPSCANYAIVLENGRGVEKDVGRAARLYEQACNARVGFACERMRALADCGNATPSK